MRDDAQPRRRERMATGPHDAVHDEGELSITRGKPLGRRFRFDGSVTIGRGRDCEVAVEDPEVSRAHARIERDEAGQFVLVDLESHNGTTVNGARVDRRVLRYGDRIALGGCELRFSRYDELAARALERQRHETLGRLATGIAHDLNNALAVVTSNVGFLVDLPHEERWSDESMDSYQDIHVATERSAELVHQLLEFARGGGEGHRLLDVSRVVDEVVALVRRSFPRSIRVTTSVERRLPVMAEGALLHQMLMNLCVNARDAILATRRSGTLTLEARLRTSAAEVVIVVQDDGCGMDEATTARVFEPFFSTRRDGSQGGIGLSTVVDIAEAHGGTVEVTSTPDKGSRFVVSLPAAAPQDLERKRSTTVSRRGGAMQGGGKVVLIVHSEAALRRSLSRVLVGAGFLVRTAASVDAAERTAVPKEAAPDAVLLELDGPTSSLDDDMAWLRRALPRVPILCVTHQGGAEQRAQARRAGATRLLTLPRGNAEVLDAILGALCGEAPADDDSDDWSRPI